VRTLPAIRSACLLLVLLGGCTSPRFYDQRFQPAPLEVEVGTQAVAGSQVRSLVTVIGIERPGEGYGARAVVRMRLENLGTTPTKLETETLSLVSADLFLFGPAEVVGSEPPGARDGEIAPGQSATYDLVFPMPDGKKVSGIDLSGLNLRFTLRFGEHPATAGATFRRLEWGYWDPGYPQVSFGVGYCWSN
jgi:hypothetical protein